MHFLSYAERIAAVPGNSGNFYAYKDSSPHGPFFIDHEMPKDSVGGGVHGIPMSQHVYLQKNSFRHRCGSMANSTDMNRTPAVSLGPDFPKLVPSTGFRCSPISDVALGHPSLMPLDGSERVGWPWQAGVTGPIKPTLPSGRCRICMERDQ